MSPSEWSPRWDSNPVLGWPPRGDSNPDLHGRNVPRLPIAPRAATVTTGGFEPPLDRLSTCCLCLIGLHGHLVPLGGLEPPPRGLRARHAPLTLQRGVELIPGFLRNAEVNSGVPLRSRSLRDRGAQTSAIPGP